MNEERTRVVEAAAKLEAVRKEHAQAVDAFAQAWLAHVRAGGEVPDVLALACLEVTERDNLWRRLTTVAHNRETDRMAALRPSA